MDHGKLIKEIAINGARKANPNIIIDTHCLNGDPITFALESISAKIITGNLAGIFQDELDILQTEVKSSKEAKDFSNNVEF